MIYNIFNFEPKYLANLSGRFTFGISIPFSIIVLGRPLWFMSLANLTADHSDLELPGLIIFLTFFALLE
jgi:hypothetical protein